MKNLYKSSSHVFNVSHLTPPQLFDSQCFGNFIFKNNFVSAIKKKALLPILLLVVTLFCSNILNAQTYNLNWGSTSWVGPTYSKTVTNIGGSGIDATVVITNTSPAGNVSAPGAAANDAFQNNSPIVGATGGVNWFLPGTTAGSPLVQWVNWNTLTSTVITVITFTRPVNGVSFYVGDMDRTSPLTYVDRITITGKNGTVAVPNPIVTKFQATATGPDTVLISGNSAFGNSTFNANAATNSITTQGATVYVQFGNPVTEITILWDQGPGATGNPAGQAIAIGDIAFTKVIPEYPPTADNFLNTPMLQGNAATAIPGLTASDLDGTVASYKITTVPSAAQGVLSIPCPPTPTGATCTGGFADLTAAVLAANPGGIVLTPTQAAAMRFDPAPNFTGNASFTFNATDNDGNISNTATYTLPVIALPPVSNNIMENSMPNTNGPTAIQGLNSSDVDGTISTYQLTTLPPTVQGVLSVPCPPTLTGATCTGGFQDLTAAILSGYPSGIPLTATQMAGMRFDPAIGFIGNATFNYNAVDNSGNTSNTANYTIPVTASATTARPPLADNITSQSINNSLGNTAIPSLSATDLDGTVASYTIGSIPPVGQGVLRVSCPSTPAGTTCTGGFAALNAGTVLTPAEAARLFFDPAPGFTGTASFTYTATDNTGSVSARLLLSNKSIDAAVLETARGGIIRKGLGYDLADIGVITNISEDHLGLDGIDTLEDLAFVKSLVIEAVKPNGYAVINADDKFADYFLKRAKSEVILFSKDKKNPLLNAHIEQGNMAVFMDNNEIKMIKKGAKIHLIKIEDVPITYGGMLECNVENCLAAVAALFGLNIPLEIIESGLRSFLPDTESNAGRFNIFDMGEFKVMLDYGHNPAGIKEAVKFIKKLDAKRFVGIIGMPGDRQDSSINSAAKICAEAFERLYIKEDADLRGRDAGEVAQIFYDVVIKSGTPKENVEIVYSEVKALEKAILDAQPGDFIVMFYEDYKASLNIINMLRSEIQNNTAKTEEIVQNVG